MPQYYTLRFKFVFASVSLVKGRAPFKKNWLLYQGVWVDQSVMLWYNYNTSQRLVGIPLLG